MYRLLSLLELCTTKSKSPSSSTSPKAQPKLETPGSASPAFAVAFSKMPFPLFRYKSFDCPKFATKRSRSPSPSTSAKHAPCPKPASPIPASALVSLKLPLPSPMYIMSDPPAELTYKSSAPSPFTSAKTAAREGPVFPTPALAVTSLNLPLPSVLIYRRSSEPELVTKMSKSPSESTSAIATAKLLPESATPRSTASSEKCVAPKAMTGMHRKRSRISWGSFVPAEPIRILQLPMNGAA
mmetsp:Transcript_14987/g.35446  ORF Transcript_14987/g.35446 Transcript_14987/m.35446 type:complete len:240 (-) Transcript_14987:3-722(-)